MDRPMLFGKFCLLERVSVGGMAEVFRAKPLGAPDPNRYFALKRILPHLAEDDDFINMFIDEARLTVQLRHPNVVQNYELGRFQSSHYIVMEFIAGQDLLALQKLVRKEKTTVNIDMACHIMHEVARGLDYVHRKTDEQGNPLGIIHRDISPQNILVSWDGKVRVIDFGIAKAASQSTHTQAGVLKGKYGYMSPEQVRGKDIDHRSDIFSMGTLFWELLTNRRLFKAANQYEVLTLIGDPEIERPSALNPKIPPEVDEIAMRALAPERENRYQWAGDLAADLHKYLSNQKPPYHRSQLTTWMRSAFAEDYEAEKEKRKRFVHINTADDVRRIFDEAYKPVATDADEALEEATQIWDVDVLPESDQNLEAFVADHTVVQAGGLELYDLEPRDEEPDTIDEDREEVEAKLSAQGLNFGSEPMQARADFTAEPTNVTVDNRQRPAMPQSLEEMTSAPTPPQGVQLIAGQGHTGEQIAPGGWGTATPTPQKVSARRLGLAALAVLTMVLLLTGAVFVVISGDKEVEPLIMGGSILVEVEPPTDLEVRLDGGLVGRDAPLTLEGLKPGSYELEIRHDDFHPFLQSLEVREGEVATAVANLGAQGELLLRMPRVPEGLQLYVGGNPISVEARAGEESTEVKLRLRRGEYVVEAISPQIRPLRKSVTVEGGEETTIDLEWVTFLRLHLAGDATQEVFLNGRSFGTLPLVWPDMNPQRLYNLKIGSVETTLGYPEIGLGRLDLERLSAFAGRTEEDYGWLQIDTGEDWWHLFIDDIDSGLVTPLIDDNKIPVLKGTRVIGLQRGEERHQFTVQVFSKETTVFRHDLGR